MSGDARLLGLMMAFKEAAQDMLASWGDTPVPEVPLGPGNSSYPYTEPEDNSSKARWASFREEGWRQKQRQRSSHLVGGQNVFNSLPGLHACFGRFERKRMNSFLQNDQGKTASAAKNWIEFAPLTDATTFAFDFVSTFVYGLFLSLGQRRHFIALSRKSWSYALIATVNSYNEKDSTGQCHEIFEFSPF